MESNIKKQSEIRYALDITLTPQELEPYYTAIYREAQKKVALNGFRKGHVPLSMIKKLHGKQLEKDVLEDAAQKEFVAAAKEHNIHPIGQAVITHLHKTDDGGLHIETVYEVMPDIQLGEYKGLTARKVVHPVSDEEVENEIESLRERMGTMADATHVADEFHGVTMDLQKLVDGTPEIGNVMRDVSVYMRSPDVNPLLKEQLLGKKIGDSFNIDLETGDNGEIFTYDVTLTDVKRLDRPAIDDDLAVKTLGREGLTVDDLNKAVREGIEREYESRYGSIFRDQLIDQLLERSSFEVPTQIVMEVLGSFYDEMKAGKKGLPKDFDEEKFARDVTPTAERVARWAMLRDMIIDREELVATDEDYEGLANIEAERTGIDYEKILGFMRSTDRYRDRILAEKALQFLEDYAIVTEISEAEWASEQARAIEETADEAGNEDIAETAGIEKESAE